MHTRSGFSLIELLVVVALIGILSSIALVSITQARIKGRDAERKMEISQFGRILVGNCYMPDAGAGEYDVADVAPEIATKHEQYAEYLAIVPRDPNGSATSTGYRYLVSEDGHCAFYANLENANERPTLTITTATVDAGTGVFESPTPGVNGSTKFFQVSN